MYQRILVPIDGSECSDKGLDEALRLARLSGGSVRLIHVVDPLKHVPGYVSYAVYSTDLVPRMKEEGERLLQRARERAEGAGVKAETRMFIDAAAVRLCDLVAEQATSWKADLIVIGSHGRRGLERVLLGSDAERILRVAPVPVLLVKATASTPQDAGISPRVAIEA